MPRSCIICSHDDAVEINRAIGKRGSRRFIAARFNVSPSALQRHKTGCLGIASQPKIAETPANSPAPMGAVDSVRFDSSDPKTLVTATARLVDEALDLLEHAKKADDRRTALQALREARDGLQLLMKAAGMLAGDGTTIDVDARRQMALKLDAQFSVDDLRAALAGQGTNAEAVETIDATEEAIDAETRALRP